MEVIAMAIKHKNERLDLRVKDSQKSYLIYAATLRDKKLSAFVLDSAMKEADEVVNQNVRFKLPERQWKTFCQALDRPAREIPALKKLFEKASVFNEQKSAS
jgi:uncharacterized protein (DUF1778 family)